MDPTRTPPDTRQVIAPVTHHLRCSAMTPALVGDPDGRSNIAAIREQVDHERRDIRSRDPHGPQPVADLRAMAVLATLWTVGEHPRAHDGPIKVGRPNHSLLPNLVPEVEG